jgi:hypothetical protein
LSQDSLTIELALPKQRVICHPAWLPIFNKAMRTPMIERLPTSIPLTINAVWRTRFWTTTPPIYIPHTEWTLSVTVDAEVPLRLARVDVYDGRATISKYQRCEGGYGVRVTKPTEIEPATALLDSPWTALNIEPPANPLSWTLIPLVKDSRGIVRLSVIGFPRQDTDGLRTGHWRIREALRSFLPVQSEAFNKGIYIAPVIARWQQNGNV